MARLALLLPLFALPWTGCAPPPAPVVPASLLVCQPRPAPPAEGADDATVAEFIVALDDRGEDCAGRLLRVREVLLP